MLASATSLAASSASVAALILIVPVVHICIALVAGVVPLFLIVRLSLRATRLVLLTLRSSGVVAIFVLPLVNRDILLLGARAWLVVCRVTLRSLLGGRLPSGETSGWHVLSLGLLGFIDSLLFFLGRHTYSLLLS